MDPLSHHPFNDIKSTARQWSVPAVAQLIRMLCDGKIPMPASPELLVAAITSWPSHDTVWAWDVKRWMSRWQGFVSGAVTREADVPAEVNPSFTETATWDGDRLENTLAE